MSLNRPLSFTLIFALALGVYSSALSGRFIWDDDYLVRDNQYLTSWSHGPEIFTKDIDSGADAVCGFYRPLQILSYRLDTLAWKFEPVGYHLTNILLHALAAWLLFLLIESFAGMSAALFSALLFLVHPVQTEAVAYISGRADLLAAVFIFSGLLLDRKRPWSLVAYALALLSKESALVFPALLWAWRSLILKERSGFRELLPHFLITAIYLGLRSTVLVPWTLPPEGGALIQRLPGVFAALFGYFRVFFWPWSGLHMEYGRPFFHWNDPAVLKGLGVFMGLAAGTAVAAKKRAGLFFGLVWFWFAWIPISGIFPLFAYMAEHWLYLPSPGLFLTAGIGFSKLKGKRAVIFGSIPIALLSATAYLQNFYWSDPVSFSWATLRYVPTSYRAEYTLGLYYGSVGQKARAASHYERAFTLNPGYTEAYYNLANLLASVHDDEAAAEYYLKAIKVGPNYAAAYNNLANLYSRMGQKKKAVEFYKKCLEIEPRNTVALGNLQLELQEKVVK